MIAFINMRNDYAKNKGYKNYFEYKLEEDYEVNLDFLNKLINDVYSKLKDKIKNVQDKKYNELKSFFNVAIVLDIVMKKYCLRKKISYLKLRRRHIYMTCSDRTTYIWIVFLWITTRLIFLRCTKMHLRQKSLNFITTFFRCIEQKGIHQNKKAA